MSKKPKKKKLDSYDRDFLTFKWLFYGTGIAMGALLTYWLISIFL